MIQYSLLLLTESTHPTFTCPSVCFLSDKRLQSWTEALFWCSNSRPSLWCDPGVLWSLQHFGSCGSEAPSSQWVWGVSLSPKPAGLKGTAQGHGPSEPGQAPHWSLYQALCLIVESGWLQQSWTSTPGTAQSQKSKVSQSVSSSKSFIKVR